VHDRYRSDPDTHRARYGTAIIAARAIRFGIGLQRGSSTEKVIGMI
jgi:hypothetical protein